MTTMIFQLSRKRKGSISSRVGRQVEKVRILPTKIVRIATTRNPRFSQRSLVTSSSPRNYSLARRTSRCLRRRGSKFISTFHKREGCRNHFLPRPTLICTYSSDSKFYTDSLSTASRNWGCLSRRGPNAINCTSLVFKATTQ
jgi:hypothetical protein